MTIPSCQLDHLVITAPALADGIDYVEQRLGCRMQPGGQHPRLGTHNALLRIGEDCYLEVIDIDPDAAPVTRPRWFQLDQLQPGSPPRLTTWVLRTSDIVTTRQTAVASGLDPGPIEDMHRGDLTWQITIPADGRLLLHGCMPSLIQWHTPQLPPARLPHCRLQLSQLELQHPAPQHQQSWLNSIGHPQFVTTTEHPQQALTAHFQTPTGTITL
ncbi:MAG: VOC family protein [Planctomyces sp.]